MKSSFSDWWLSAAVRGLGLVVRALPLSWALAAGRGVGTLVYWGQPKRRAVGLNNLRAAWGAERSVEELARICHGSFQQLGMSFVEMLLTPAIDRGYVARWLTIEGREHLDQAVAQRRGVVLVTAHVGNWELPNLAAGLLGYPMSVLARQQGSPQLNRLLNRYRESKGCQVISKGMAVRTMIRRLQQGGIVGMLADQDAGRHGELVPFFGRLASTATGPVALALDVGCPILPVVIRRTRGPAHTIVIEPPLAVSASGSVGESLRAGVAAYMQVVERHVRRAPEQWLWAHRRWKSSPHRAVVALSDGRAGHRTQLLAAADLVTRAWSDRVAEDPRVTGAMVPAIAHRPWMTQTVVEVRYRARVRRGLLALATGLGLVRVGGARRWLRWALMPETWQALERAWATVTVSCGAATGLVNVLWSRGLGANTVHILRPPWPIARHVDLCIIPQHDRVTADCHTIVTRGALHAVLTSATSPLGDGASGAPAGEPPVQIGVLLGGDSRGIRLPASWVAVVIEQLLEAVGRLAAAASGASPTLPVRQAGAFGTAAPVSGDGTTAFGPAASGRPAARLLVTTSRRTSPAVEAWLARRLTGHPCCALLVLANRDPVAGGAAPVGGVVPRILAASQLLVVSGESISMVSEAVACGKPVVAFEPRALWPWPKYRRFLKTLEWQGSLRVVRRDQVSQAVVDGVLARRSVSVVDDRAMVLARLRSWL